MALRRRRILIHLLCWALILALAFVLDGTVCRYVHAMRWDRQGVIRNTFYSSAARLPGHLLFTLVLAVAMMIFARLHWRKALLLVLCAALTGSNWLLKWMAGRARPRYDGKMSRDLGLHPFSGGWERLMDSSAGAPLSFPSGDTALAFATAACLARYYPRGRALFYLGASAVAIQRVLVNAHYLSDVVAGAALGVGTTALLFWCLAPRLGVEGTVGDDAKRILLAGDSRLQRAGDGRSPPGASGKIDAADSPPV